MIRNYFTIAWRNLVKNRAFAFINIFGLTIGLACCMLIAAFVYDELNYDTYAKDAGRIYRVGLRVNAGDSYPSVDVAVGPGMKNAFPEILATARLAKEGEYFMEYKENQFKEKNIVYVDSNFLEMFSIPLIEGNPKTALAEPNSAVITKEIAHKYFGNEPALGKFLNFAGGRNPHKITGIIEKVPENSHFHGDLFLTITDLAPVRNPTWSNIGWFTYVLLAKDADPKKLEAKFPPFVRKNVAPEVSHDMGISLAEAQSSKNSFRFYLTKITDIHLHSDTRYELEASGDIHYVYIFGALALLIILLACVNFTNLSTANAVKRSKEIGIRKVMGSAKKQLILQFLAESILMTVCALVFALVVVALLLPIFNTLSGKSVAFVFFMQPWSLFAMVLLVLFVGLLAGLYPAFFLSSLNIIKTLKGGSIGESTGRGNLRKSLVVFQFAVSTALIISTIVVYRQLHYMQSQKLGYDKEQVLSINDSYILRNKQSVFAQQLMQDSRVISTTVARNYPGNQIMDGTEVYARQNDNNEKGEEIHMNIYHIDERFIPTLGIHVIKGRNFSKDFPSDSSGILINETAARSLGWVKTDPIGRTILRSGQIEFRVIGVVKDFHYASLKNKIAPLMMMLGNNGGGILVKLRSTEIKPFIDETKTKWGEFHTETPFAYTFLDDHFDSLYKGEEKTALIFTVFAVIAILIASLGLFGLVSFTTEQRTKEIGIRKVLGATTRELLVLLSKDFLYLVMIAFLVTIPLTWLAMNQWLKNFAYRLTPEWWVFVCAGILALLIAMITISFKAIKAALANPVKSLRTE